MKIADATGTSTGARVNSKNRLVTSSAINPRIFFTSRDDGLAFTATSISASNAAGEYPFYLKNNSTTKNLYIKQIHFNAANNVLWKTWVVTGTAAGGSAITPTNINISSGRTADVVCRGSGSVTGLTATLILDAVRSVANAHEHTLYEDALILGPGNAIAVEYDTGTTGANEIVCMFHLEEIGFK